MLTLSEIETYVRMRLPVVVNQLGLSNWTISLVFKKGPKSGVTLATTATVDQYKDARITFYECSYCDSYEELDSTIVHELLHLVLAKFEVFYELFRPSLTNTKDQAVFEKLYEIYVEYLVQDVLLCLNALDAHKRPDHETEKDTN